MNSMYVLLCVLSPIYIFPMNTNLEIRNMCNQQVTVQYRQRWGSDFASDASKLIQPKELSSLEKVSVSRKDRLVVTIPGFQTAQDIVIKPTTCIVIKQENKNEIMISQGLYLLANMKAVNGHARRISCKKKNQGIEKAAKTVRPELVEGLRAV